MSSPITNFKNVFIKPQTCFYKSTNFEQILTGSFFRRTFLISDAETLSQTWLSVAGVAWLSFQAKLNGNFLLYVVLTTTLGIKYILIISILVIMIGLLIFLTSILDTNYSI
jgi:hypothetical protein